MSPTFCGLKDGPDLSLQPPREGTRLGVLEPHDAASSQDEPVVPRSSFSQGSVHTKLVDLGEQPIWLDVGGE